MILDTLTLLINHIYTFYSGKLSVPPFIALLGGFKQLWCVGRTLDLSVIS